jgi:hypothetical protein
MSTENENSPPRSNAFLKYWRQIGGGSLTLSLLIHAGILIVAGLIVFTQTQKELPTDFLSGGGSDQGAKASSEMKHQVQQKNLRHQTKSVPKSKIVVENSLSSIQLPDTPMDSLALPDMSSSLSGGGRMSGGFGTGGAGGGFSNGMGSGAMGGMNFKPLMMFGKEMKDTRKIAVIMDVSRSMTRYLPAVVDELDRVAPGSTVILYFGCGLKTQPKNLSDRVRTVEDPAFSKFWQFWQGKTDMAELRVSYKSLKYDPTAEMPLAEIYQRIFKRKNTYFIDFNGIQFASSALMSTQVERADTLYWFADFQDMVDEAEMQRVQKRLENRRQKLYIHAVQRGTSFDTISEQLVAPLGGEVIETELGKTRKHSSPVAMQ